MKSNNQEPVIPLNESFSVPPLVTPTLSSAIDKLERSTETLDSNTKQQLDKARHLSLDKVIIRRSTKGALLKLANSLLNLKDQYLTTSLAFALPMVLIASLLLTNLDFHSINQTLDSNTTNTGVDIYADIDLLADEQQLDFLAELDISDWLLSEDES